MTKTFEKYRVFRNAITRTAVNVGYNQNDVSYLLTHIRPMLLKLAKEPDCGMRFVAQVDGDFILNVETVNPIDKVRILRTLHKCAQEECDYCYRPEPLEVYTFCNGHFGLIIC